MKKVLALLVVSGMVFVACGPSQEEIAAEEARIQDSIAQVEAEALAAEEAAAAAAEEARIQDSIAQAEAEALAAATTTVKTTVKKVVSNKQEETAAPKTAAERRAAMKDMKQTN